MQCYAQTVEKIAQGINAVVGMVWIPDNTCCSKNILRYTSIIIQIRRKTLADYSLSEVAAEFASDFLFFLLLFVGALSKATLSACPPVSSF